MVMLDTDEPQVATTRQLALVGLAARRGGLTSVDVQAHRGIFPGSAWRILDGLVRLGMLTRTDEPRRGRTGRPRGIYIATAAGRAALSTPEAI